MNRRKIADDAALKYDVKTRINQFHFDRLTQMLTQSHYRSMSELLRDLICEGKVRVITKDESLDVIMEPLTGLRKEIHAIGVNLNQVARALNTPENRSRSIQIADIADNIKTLQLRMNDVFELVSRLSKKWLQG